MAHKSSWPGMRDALRAMITRIEGKPCVYLNRYTKQVFVCSGISDIRADEDLVAGRNRWVDPPEARLDYLTDEFSLGYDLLQFGPDCWYDEYFQAWYVFDPEMVARSMRGDHTWAGPYLGLDKTPFPHWAGDFPWHPPGGLSSDSAPPTRDAEPGAAADGGA